MMSNGYKPAPLDLSDVKLLPPQEILVDKLAENAHNVWAKDRIKQGWTYGIQQVRDAGELGNMIIHHSAILLWRVIDGKMEIVLALSLSHPVYWMEFVMVTLILTPDIIRILQEWIGLPSPPFFFFFKRFTQLYCPALIPSSCTFSFSCFLHCGKLSMIFMLLPKTEARSKTTL